MIYMSYKIFYGYLKYAQHSGKFKKPNKIFHVQNIGH